VVEEVVVILLHLQEVLEGQVLVDQEKEYKLLVHQHKLVNVVIQEHMVMVVLVEQVQAQQELEVVVVELVEQEPLEAEV
jgi:hypothetical protein